MDHENVLGKLSDQEPIFHQPHFAASLEEFARLMAPDYWEIGASGCRYDREFILRHLAANPPVDSHASGWTCSEFALRKVGAETYLLTYLLTQGERVSRRMTAWRNTAARWQILYHQGTLVAVKQ